MSGREYESDNSKRRVRYHSAEWDTLASLGWVTMGVDAGGVATMLARFEKPSPWRCDNFGGVAL